MAPGISLFFFPFLIINPLWKKSSSSIIYTHNAFYKKASILYLWLWWQAAPPEAALVSWRGFYPGSVTAPPLLRWRTCYTACSTCFCPHRPRRCPERSGQRKESYQWYINPSQHSSICGGLSNLFYVILKKAASCCWKDSCALNTSVIPVPLLIQKRGGVPRFSPKVF